MEILVDKKTIFKILKNRKKLKEKLGIDLVIGKSRIVVNGDADREYMADKVIQAIEAGFSTDAALLLTEEDYLLERINIKDISRKKPEVIRARVIGTQGKTISTLCNLSDCFIKLKDNDVFIIGTFENIKAGIQALKSLIGGAKQGNVYKYLEKARTRKKLMR